MPVEAERLSENRSINSGRPETDDAFREAFARAPAEALRKLGHTEAAPCLALKPGATLASPEQIKASRAKLEQSLAGIQSATCPLDAQEGM